MKTKNKPHYGLWRNTGFMVALAWKECKSVLVITLALALTMTAKSVVQLLVAPAILGEVEAAAPVPELLLTIAIFSGALFLVSGLEAYLDLNTLFGRIQLRMRLIHKVVEKMAETAYPNMLDTDFLAMHSKADEANSSNDAPTEHIWTTWTNILNNVFGFLVYLALLSGLNPLLLVVVILTTAIGFFINRKLNSWGYEHREEYSAYWQKMSYLRRAETSRNFAKDIRIFGLRDWLEAVWDKTTALYRGFIEKREKVYLWTNVVDLVLTLCRNGIAYAYLLWLTLSQGLPASEFLLYFGAVSGFTQWVTGILSEFSTLHRESLDISTVREFLDWPEPFNFGKGDPLPQDDGQGYEITLEDVSYRYPGAEKDIFSHLNLTIHKGEKLAVVGLNGAGKTTLVKLACGFLDPDKGRVLLNGVDIRRFNRREYYSLFSAVFQDFSVLDATLAENVAQQVDGIDEQKVWRCLDEAGLTEKVKSLPQGLRTHIGRQVFEDGVELSGGETQRLMLARALYKDGPVLLLDEPTAALDPIAENDIYQKYNEMTAGRTSVFISHRLASTRFCDRILYLADGKIAEEGTHESLLKLGGGYAHLFEIQSQYYQEGSEYHGAAAEHVLH